MTKYIIDIATNNILSIVPSGTSTPWDDSTEFISIESEVSGYDIYYDKTTNTVKQKPPCPGMGWVFSLETGEWVDNTQIYAPPSIPQQTVGDTPANEFRNELYLRVIDKIQDPVVKLIIDGIISYLVKDEEALTAAINALRQLA